MKMHHIHCTIVHVHEMSVVGQLSMENVKKITNKLICLKCKIRCMHIIKYIDYANTQNRVDHCDFSDLFCKYLT